MVEKLFNITMVNATIGAVLMLWIVAVYGYGLFGFKLACKRWAIFRQLLLDSPALASLLAFIAGGFGLMFFVAVWHLFFPLWGWVSIAALVLGIVAFGISVKAFVAKWRKQVCLSAALALLVVLPLAFLSDSVGDSVNYHIQIVSWIQESPLVFGLGNVHTRLGYNGLVYGFYALTDVSQIIPQLRSFIGNEAFYFSFLFSAFWLFARLLVNRTARFYELFAICALLPFPLILKWGEFMGLYVEGVGVVFGVAIFATLLYILQRDSVLGNHSSDFVDFRATADHKSCSAPKSTKSTTSNTATPRIREEESQSSLRGEAEAIHKQSLDFSAKVDCHADKSARNDKNSSCEKLDSSDNVLSPSSRADEIGVAIHNSAQAESINQSRGTRNLESVQGVWGSKGDKGERFASSSPVPLEKSLSQTKLESSESAQKVDSSEQVDCHALPSDNARNDKNSNSALDYHALPINKACNDKNSALGNDRDALPLFATLFVFALFATMVKIANFALILAVALVFVLVYRSRVFSKKLLLGVLGLGALSVVFVAPWVLKGLATSGMIAYPASIGYITSLPWAVSEQMRSGEVCWIMSWARAPMKNCHEVLASNAWMIEWFSMKTRYFSYFKYFVYSLFIGLGFALGARLFTRRGVSGFGAVLASVCVGVVYWFFAGPDPRFGMVYLIPLLALIFAYVLYQSYMARSWWMALGFVLACAPMFMNGRHMFVIVWGVVLVLLMWQRLQAKYLLGIFTLFSLIAVPNLYRHDKWGILEYPKVREVYVQERVSDLGVLEYVRFDTPNENTKAILYEARPMTPYFNQNLGKGQFLGREMFYTQEPAPQETPKP